MSVAVVVDGGAALSPARGAELGVGVVPLYVLVGGREWRDHELPLDEMVIRVGEGATVSTSTPSPGDYLTAVEAAAAAGHSAAVVVTVASTLSGSCASATTAAGLAPVPVHVVDSGSAAGAQALVATAAARTASSGATAEEVAAQARRVAQQVRLIAAIGSLDWLARSGRVPHVAAWAGRTLRMVPLFSVGGGEVSRHRPAVGREAAAERIARTCRAGARAGARLRVTAMYADDEAAATALLDRATEGLDVAESHVCRFSTGMVAHSGPDLVGLAWWWD